MDQSNLSLECSQYVAKLKEQWAVPPSSMRVVEYLGTGDPFFGGNAEDLVLTSSGRLAREWVADKEGVAEFATIEEAHEAARLIGNRRPGSILGVVPAWRRQKPVQERYPRLLKALRVSCLLTETEAIGVLNGVEGEAVGHLGGRQQALQSAWRSRHILFA